MSDVSTTSYTAREGRGDVLNSTCQLYVWLYANYSDDEPEVDDIVPYLKETLDKVYENTLVDRYEINVYDGNPEITETSQIYDDGGFKQEWRTWLSDHSFTDYKGIHVCVTDAYDMATAENVETSDYSSTSANGQTAFTTKTDATVGTASGNRDRYCNFACQEPMHNVIRADLDSVNDMFKSNHHHHEHDLGHVDGNGAVTPLATLYAGNDPRNGEQHASHGTCSTAYSYGDAYNNMLTGCSIDAIDITARTEI